MTRLTYQAILDRNARVGLASANRGNPFWTQSQAMTAINETRYSKVSGGAK